MNEIVALCDDFKEISNNSEFIERCSKLIDDGSEYLAQNQGEKNDFMKFVSFSMELCRNEIEKSGRLAGNIHKLNGDLSTRTFFCCERLTIVDICFFPSVKRIISKWNKTERYFFNNITRWFDLVQHTDPISSIIGLDGVIDIDLNYVPPESELNQMRGNKRQQGQKAKGGQKQQRGQQRKGRQQQPQQIKDDVCRLDIRVGKVLKCTKHQGADSLYVEEIDVGEEKPRQVVSGLVKHVRESDLLDRKVLLLCNLKPSSLKGVLSQAMILCACNEDHSKVEVLDPPSDCPVGDRITFPNTQGEPDTQLNAKNWKKVQSQLRTNGCVAMYKDLPFTTSKGNCKSQTIDGSIS